MRPFQTDRFRKLQEVHKPLHSSFQANSVDSKSPWLVRAIALVSPQSPFQNELSPGWSDGSLDLKNAMYGAAKDAFVLKVHQVFCIPPWENKPCLKEVAYPRRSASNRVRWSEVVVDCAANSSHKRALVYRILAWDLEGSKASHDQVASLNVYRPLRPEEGFQQLGQAVASELKPVDSFQDLPVLCLPSEFVFALSCNSWDQIPVLARWVHPFFPMLSEGLPRDWLVSVPNLTSDSEGPVAIEELLSHQKAEELFSCLRRMGNQVLRGILDEDIASGVRLEVNAHLQALRNHLFALESTQGQPSTHLAHIKFPSDSFVQQVISSLDLKNKAKLQQHAARFVRLMPDALKPYLEAWTSTKIASGSTLRRGELMLDCALELLHRTRLSQAGKVFKFAWGDSTDKWDLEIYNARYRWLKQSDCVELARAWRFLCNHPFHKDMEPDLLEKRQEFSTLLFESIHMHTLVPQLLGDRKTALVDKVAAHVHASLLESMSLEDLDDNFASHIAWCSDHGVEAGVPSFHVARAEQVLPEWLQQARVNVDPGDDFFEDGAFLNSAMPHDQSTLLMPNSIPIPGVCHVVHNSTVGLDAGFQGFEPFLDKLKSLYRFLDNPKRCERFLEAVMRGSLHFERAKELFQRKLTSIYTERWNVLAICLEESLPSLLFLRAHWDEVRYADKADADPSRQDGWNPASVTSIIKDNYFLAFWRMQLSLRSRLLDFQSWAEGCSCHGGMAFVEDAPPQGLSDPESKRTMNLQCLLRSEIQSPPDVPCRCPMAGCQAPFFASNFFPSLISFLDKSCHVFIAECQERLTSEEWANLLSEWQHGTSVIIEQLRARLEYFSNLPWILFGGAHPDIAVARAALQKAQDLWLALPAAAKKQQHAHVQKLFGNSDSILTQELHAFIASDHALETYPNLEKFLAPFAFVQVAERLIEAAHKDLGHSRPKNFSMTMLSLNMRMPELHKFLSIDRGTEAFSLLVESFNEARHIQNFVKMFPCHRGHPDFLQLCRSKDKHKFLSVVRKALYRDSLMQFADNKDALKFHERARPKGKTKSTKTTEDMLVANLAADCVRNVAWETPGSVFSIKEAGHELTAKFKWFSPVLLQPSLLKQPAHAPGTLQDYQRNDVVVTVFANQGSPEKPVVSAIVLGKNEVLSFQSVVQSLGIDQFLESFCLWSKSGDVRYVLPLLGGQVSKVLRKMVECGALPKACARFAAAESESSAMESLLSAGYVEQGNDGYLLTESALKRMDFLRGLTSPKALVFSDRLSLTEMTELQLFARMRSEGWKWSLLPTKEQQQIVFKLGQDRVWFTAGVTVSRFYMMCLLDAKRLKTLGIAEIPHGMPSEVYESVFAGTLVSEAQRRFSQSKRKRQVPLDVDVEVEGQETGAFQTSLAPQTLQDAEASGGEEAEVEDPHPVAGSSSVLPPKS